ncbi:MAG: orc1/cdc6 family replication initiation protein, partial [archaeon]|nr:orc1/cdc6 family replication initiation protein [archaeon]
MTLSLEVFADDYPVEVIVDRDEEKLIIKDYLEDVLKGKKRALHIHGSPGLGKTTVTKHVANQFEDSFNAEIIYINCANSTPNQALHEIHDRICGECDRKIPSKALVQKILNHNFKAKEFTLVVILDNFDRMQHVDDLLWDINGISPKLPRLGLLLISTSEMKLKNLIGNRLY